MRFPSCSEALAALARGLDEQTCHDFKAIRQVVMCDAWHGRQHEPFTPDTFHSRIEESWRKIDHACAAHGGTRPETGFLTPEISKGMPSNALARITHIREVRKNGLHAGVIVEEDNGSTTLCVDSNCGTTMRGAGPVENMVVILETAGYEVVD